MSACFPCLTPRTQSLIGLSLMAFMAATRFHHFGDSLHLPDASWALFFVAGFYLSPVWFLALLVEAVAIDAAAVGWMGVSAYCLTPAYAGLQLAHAALWLGGRWLARNGEANLNRLAASALVTTAAAFFLSNTAFYWFGGRVAETSLAQYLQTFADYAPSFFASTLMYLGLAALIHGVSHARRPTLMN